MQKKGIQKCITSIHAVYPIDDMKVVYN